MQTHPASRWRGPVTSYRSDWPRVGDAPLPRLDDLDIRTDLVCRIRREIAQGIYETPEKLEAALNRLLEQLEE